MKKPHFYEKGDLVVISKGANNKVYRITGFNHVQEFANGEMESVMVYDLNSIIGSKFLNAPHDEVLLVCPKAHSTKYILHLDSDGNAPASFKDFPSIDYILDEIAKILSVKQKIGELSEEKEEQLEHWKTVAKDLHNHHTSRKEA